MKNPAEKTRLWPLLLAPPLVLLLSLAISALLHAHPQTIDALMRLYGPLSSILPSMLFGAAPFSVAEALLLLAVPAAVALLVRTAKLLLQKRMPLKRLLHGILTLALIASTLLASFDLGWGLNYYRTPIANELRLQTGGRSTQALATLYADLLRDANTLRARLREDEHGVFDPGSRADILKAVPRAYKRLGTVWPRFDRPFPVAKPVLLSRIMSYSGITGIYIPFTSEPNVNVDAPKLLLYAVAAHETAHLGGVAPEDEANFVAYVACMYSSDPAMQYSGTVHALIYAGNALRAADAELFNAVHDGMGEALRRDLRAYNAYWAAFDGPVREQAEQVNDTYLKRNGQLDGTKSYGRMVDLLLAWKGY